MHRPIDIPSIPASLWSEEAWPDPVATPVWPSDAAPVHPVAAALVNLSALDLADQAVDGPQARSDYGVTGAGMKIGILSDSFNELGGAGEDSAAGLLPAQGVTVLSEGPPGGTDEGRAMAEIAHATAPDAQLYFYTADNSETDFAAGIAALRQAGCQIIVDDIEYADEPMFQVAGPISTAVAQAVAAGTNYFTAAGNEGSGFYQAAFAPVTGNVPGLGLVAAQRFAGGATTVTVTVPAEDETTLALDWNAPYNADNADSITIDQLGPGGVVASSTQAGSEPVVALDFPMAAEDATYTVAVVANPGTPVPSLFKMVMAGGGSINDPGAGIGSGSALGHALVPGVNAVGAVDIAATPAEGGTPTPEPYSSTGPGELLYAPDGTPLATPQAAGVPSFLAPDGAATDPVAPFYGTSAAAPVAAAVAALMLQAQPALSNADVTALLADSAIPAGASSVAGAGLIQADLAVGYASTGVIAGSQQTVLLGTSRATTILSGSANHWIEAGSGATVIEAQGADTVIAGSGADTVDLTGPAAQLWGNTGPLYVRSTAGSDTVIGINGAMTVAGGSGSAVVFGSAVAGDVLTAGAQPSFLVARSAGDLLTGLGAHDILYAAGAGTSTLTAGAGGEILAGWSSGSGDVFNAGAGAPLIAPFGSSGTIVFGSGDAVLLAGSAAEALQFTRGSNGSFDVVYDFDPSQDFLLMHNWGGQQAAVTQAIADQYDTGGSAWVTLPDGTVIAFVGQSHLAASSVTFG